MIFLGPEVHRLCRAHAERVVAAYQAGRKPRSEAIDREGERLHGVSIRNDVDTQTVGRLGEWGTAAEEFKRLHRTAGTCDKLWTGTPYMDAEKCHPFKTLPQHERPLL